MVEPIRAEAGLGLLQIINLMLRRGWRIFGAMVGVGALAAAIGWLVVPVTYEAEAVLVYSPTLGGDANTVDASIEVFHALAQSAEILANTRQSIPAAHEKTLKEFIDRCEVSFPTRRDPNRTVVPLLNLRVEWESAETAQQIANKWSELLHERALVMKTESLEALQTELDTQVQRTRERLKAAHQNRIENLRAGRTQINQAIAARDKTLTEQTIADQTQVAELRAQQRTAENELLATLHADVGQLADTHRQALAKLSGEQLAARHALQGQRAIALAALDLAQLQSRQAVAIGEQPAAKARERDAILADYFTRYAGHLATSLDRDAKAEVLRRFHELVAGKTDAALQTVLLEDLAARRRAIDQQIAQITEQLKSVPETRRLQIGIPELALWLSRRDLQPSDLERHIEREDFNPLFWDLKQQLQALDQRSQVLAAAETAFAAAFAALSADSPDTETALRQYLLGMALVRDREMPTPDPIQLQAELDALQQPTEVASRQIAQQFARYLELSRVADAAEWAVEKTAGELATARLQETNQWEQQLQALAETHANARATLETEQQFATEALVRLNDAKLAVLRESHRLALTDLERRLELARETSRRQADGQIEALEKALDLELEQHTELTKTVYAELDSYSQKLVETQQSLSSAASDLFVASRAVEPDTPKSRGLTAIAASLALLAGLLLFAGFLLRDEILPQLRARQSTDSAAPPPSPAP